MLANVIIPACAAPYISIILYPLVVLAEFLVLWRLHRTCNPGPLVGLTFAANGVSSIVGIFIVDYLFVPDGYVLRDTDPRILVAVPNWPDLVAWGFVQAFVLSVVIEYFCFLPWRRSLHLSRLEMGIVFGNAITYGALYCLFAAMFFGRSDP